MNKKFKYYSIIWAILFILFNVITWVVPSNIMGMNKTTGGFWAGYIFINFAFVGQLVCAYFGLKTDNLTKLFYNIPIISVSYIGLIITLFVGVLCMAIPNMPNWIGIILCLLILGFTAIAVIKAKATSDVVERIDEKVKGETLFIKSLTVDAENLLKRATTDDEKALCKKVYEAVRYSDPISNEALVGLESQITIKFNELSSSVGTDLEKEKKFADEFLVLIGDRNSKCKLLK